MKQLFTVLALISPLFFSAANAAYPTVADVKRSFEESVQEEAENNSQSMTEKQKQQQAVMMSTLLSMISFDSVDGCQGDENAIVTCEVTMTFTPLSESEKKESKTESMKFTKDSGKWKITD